MTKTKTDPRVYLDLEIVDRRQDVDNPNDNRIHCKVYTREIEYPFDNRARVREYEVVSETTIVTNGETESYRVSYRHLPPEYVVTMDCLSAQVIAVNHPVLDLQVDEPLAVQLVDGVVRYNG